VKAAIFHPSARAAIRLFPHEVRRELGKAIFDLQKGEILSMPLSRGMASIAPGAAELRIRDRSGSFRVLYYTRSAGDFGFPCIREKDPDDSKVRIGFREEAAKGATR
jgi:phage-related protein